MGLCGSNTQPDRHFSDPVLSKGSLTLAASFLQISAQLQRLWACRFPQVSIAPGLIFNSLAHHPL